MSRPLIKRIRELAEVENPTSQDVGKFRFYFPDMIKGLDIIEKLSKKITPISASSTEVRLSIPLEVWNEMQAVFKQLNRSV